MKQRFHVWWAFVLTLCVLPLNAFADGVSPILNFFHKDTVIPATIVTAIIILVESGLLRWQFNGIPYIGSLWRSAVINAVSSATGSLLLLAYNRDSYFMWDTMSFVLPLFLITLATEIPLLHYLYKSIQCTWWKSIRAGIYINILSYFVVFVVEIGMLFAWLGYAGHLDKKNVAEWNHPELLKGATGRIYATETLKGSHRFRYYNVEHQTWNSLSNCPAIDPQIWDIEGNVCAVIETSPNDWTAWVLTLASLPNFATIQRMNREHFLDQGTGNTDRIRIKDIKISPDRKQVAILLRVEEAVAYKDAESHYILGDKCRLIILDVQTGKILTRANRWASDFGLCWLPDSRAVVFSSFRNEELYKTRAEDVKGGTGYGIGYKGDDQFASGLYLFDVSSGKIEFYTEGCYPVLDFAQKTLLLETPDVMKSFIIETRKTTVIPIKNFVTSRACLSPDGSLILAEIRRNTPFFAGGNLVVIDKQDSQRRHIVSTDVLYKFLWTKAE